MLIEDHSLEVMALLECDDYLSSVSSRLTPGSLLHLAICRIHVRVGWLLRQRHLSRSQLDRLERQEAYLRRFLLDPDQLELPAESLEQRLSGSQRRPGQE